METYKFRRWLSTKIYLINLGTYATVIAVTILPSILSRFVMAPSLLIDFIVYFIAAFSRAIYESLIVNEAKKISFSKITLLALVMATLLSLLANLAKPKLGYFAIPVAVLVSLKVVAGLKSFLWPMHEHKGFFAELPAKLDQCKVSMYGFFSFLVGITYVAYGLYNFNFYFSFTAAFFVGALFEELYNLCKVFEQHLVYKSVFAIAMASMVCAITASSLVCLFMSTWGLQGQPATIVSVIITRLLLPKLSTIFNK